VNLQQIVKWIFTKYAFIRSLTISLCNYPYCMRVKVFDTTMPVYSSFEMAWQVIANTISYLGLDASSLWAKLQIVK